MPIYQIFYARRPTFQASGSFGTPRLTVISLADSHAPLCEVEADSLDDAWWQMQAEYWSPNGEGRPLLERLGLSHASMSVGDVIQDDEGKYWECLDLGWRPVEEDAQGDDNHGKV